MDIRAALSAYRAQSDPEGATPWVWLWNFGVSFSWGRAGDYLISGGAGALARAGDEWPELGLLVNLLAEPGDLLLKPAEVTYDSTLRDYWRGAGIEVPVLETFEKGAQSPARPARPRLVCFGTDREAERLAVAQNWNLFGAGADVVEYCNSKAVVKKWCHDLGLPTPTGAVCPTLADVGALGRSLLEQYGEVVVKEPYSASGKGIVIVRSQQRLAALLRRFQAAEDSEGVPALVVERWHPTVASHNTQYLIMPNGEWNLLCQTEQVLNQQKYVGNRFRVGWQTPDCPILLQMQQRIVDRVRQAGYHGVLGVDSIVTSDGAIMPAIELNARFNLSTYAAAVLSRIGVDRVAALRSYLIKCRRVLSLTEFMTGDGGWQYCAGTRSGALPIAYTGESSPSAQGVLRIALLFVGETESAVNAIQQQYETELARRVPHGHGLTPQEGSKGEAA